MKEKLNLFYLANSRHGGWVTFTAHLKHGLGDGARIFRVTKTDERKERDFGYGVAYRNITHETAIRMSGPKLIVSADKNFRETQVELIKQGAWLVIHDPTELRNPDFRNIVEERRTIILGKKAKEYLPQANLIPHPYKPVNPIFTENLAGEWENRPQHCVSVSRLDFDKNSHWLFEANRKLPEDKRINIRGAENRMYTRTKLMPKYPEYIQDSNRPKDNRQVFPREFNWAVDFLSKAKFMTDFSLISGDGGRTQYTFMEAWDAGTIVLLHKGWILPDDDMVDEGLKQNCISFSKWEELEQFLRTDIPKDTLDLIRYNGKEKLKDRDCIKIGQQYLDVIDV